MHASDSRIDDRWRSFFAERCHPDVDDLVGAYPERRSLHVDLVDLYDYDDAFALGFFEEPGRHLRRSVEVLCAGYDALEHVNVRVTNNPALFRIADLGAEHLHELVTVEGVAASVGGRDATAAVAVFECDACGATETVRPYGVRLSAPRRCEACEASGALAFDPERSTFVDLRRVEFAEPPADVEDDAEPLSVDVYLADDLADAVSAGDQLLVTGVLRPVRAGPSNRFERSLDGLTVAEERSAVDDRSLAEVIESRWETAAER